MSDTSCLPRHPVRKPAIAFIGLSALGAAAAMAWRCRRVTVRGESMVPALLPGDRVLVIPVRHVRVGQVVAVPDPRWPARILVKRVASIDRPSGTLLLMGDNRLASTDSRAFGSVRRATVIGRAVYRYSPVERSGRLTRGLPGGVR